MNFSDILIVSDIDGTLVNTPDPIPQRNLDALRRFTAAGGHFALATGRSVNSARRFVDQVPVNAPCVVFNGSAIFDYEKEAFVYTRPLADTFRDHTRALVERFPQLGVALVGDFHTAAVVNPELVLECIGDEDFGVSACPLDEAQGPFLKSIMMIETEFTEEVEQYGNSLGFSDVTFIRSGPVFVEMLPVGETKGSGIIHLAGSMGKTIENVVAIGDYYNDFEMLKTAGFPVTVAEAPDDIKAICRFVTGSCDGGALADLIEHLEAAR